MKIRKGDNVQILAGKDRGRSGKVLRVFRKEGKVLVEGVNIYKRHVRKTRDFEGGIVELSRPVDVSNVALICSGCKKPTRIGFKMEGDNKVRICRKCQTVLV